MGSQMRFLGDPAFRREAIVSPKINEYIELSRRVKAHLDNPVKNPISPGEKEEWMKTDSSKFQPTYTEIPILRSDGTQKHNFPTKPDGAFLPKTALDKYRFVPGEIKRVNGEPDYQCYIPDDKDIASLLRPIGGRVYFEKVESKSASAEEVEFLRKRLSELEGEKSSGKGK